MISDNDRKMIEESMDRIAQRRGVPFIDEHHAAVFELLRDPFWGASLSRMESMNLAERDQWVEGLLRFSLIGEGETLPTPEAITIEVLSKTSDDLLAQLLYDFVCEFLSRSAAYDEERYREAILDLPRGLLIVFLLTALDGEISNGGFYQFFTNSSGEFVPETLQACTLAGYLKHREVLVQAIEAWEPARRLIELSKDASSIDETMWEQIDVEVAPKLDEFTSAYFQLEDRESFCAVIANYVRKHPEECLLELPPASDES